MCINNITESSALQQNNNNCSNLDVQRENLASQVNSITNTTESLQTIYPTTQATIIKSQTNNKKNNRQYIPGTKLFPSAKNEVVAFESQLKKGKRPFVHFPPFARGDMNAYKYIGFLNEGARPLTAFEYQGSKESQEMPLNENISVIKEHIDSMGSKLKEGRDYILCSSSELQRLQNEVNIKKKKCYQYYDSIISIPTIRKVIHEQFRCDINSNSKIKGYFESKSLPCPSVGRFKRQNRLIMVNINIRKPQQDTDPRLIRHTTPEIAHMQNLVDCIYNAKNEANKRIKEDQFDICFAGSEFNQHEQELWKEYGSKKGVNVLFFNDLVRNGFNRLEQREVLFALSDQYKSTIYIGHQSGVNEDAPILPRTNVYSLSEYLGAGQVGISRVEKRSQLDIMKRGPLGIPIHASTVGNFYSLRNSEFLTTEGILAAIQLKLSLNSKNHQPLDKLWEVLISRYAVEIGNKNTEIPNDRAADELLSLILNDVKNNTIDAEAKNSYRDAINIIVQRMKGNAPYLSERSKKYFINVMKEELSLHDGRAPLTQHERKREAQNADMTRCTFKSMKPNNPRGEERINLPENPKDNYLALLDSNKAYKQPKRKI